MTVVAKVCTRCGEGKMLTEYPLKPGGKHGRGARCLVCCRVLRKKYHTDRNRVDQTVRVHRKVKAQMTADAKKYGVREGMLASYALAAGLAAMRDGRLPVPGR